MSSLRRIFQFVLVASLLGAAVARGQVQSGGLYGSVSDDNGAALPGVAVTLSGVAAPQSQQTDELGRFRFVNLGPGSYTLRAELEGFAPVQYPSVAISIGKNAEMQITLNQTVTDVITVTTEVPLLDTTPGQTTTVGLTELESIPTARDPWAVLQSTPGVLTDRVNVGGNESGQQSQYVGPGSGGDQAVWALDGMVITDMSAVGSSPGYYDFDSFEEMQVTTGGSDAAVATPGVVLNMVTKRGTNEWRGSARYLVGDEGSSSNLEFDLSDLGAGGPWNTVAAPAPAGPHGQGAFSQGNRIIKVEDTGLEIGGPLLRDRVWIWGSYAKPEVDLRTINNFKDFTSLEGWNFKLNANFTPANSATLFAYESDKVKLGRNAGPTRPQPTTWDQSGFGDSPAAYKVEDSHFFGGGFYLLGRYSKVNGGFQLVPEGGDVIPFLDTNGVWQNSFFLIQIERPQEQFVLEGSTSFGGSVSHELKFGAGLRTVEQSTLSRTQGGAYEIEAGGGQSLYAVARDGFIRAEASYDSAYVQDTISFDRFTANVGVNLTRQSGSNLASTAVANRFASDILPAVSFAGGDAGFEWQDITPRLGFTYSLGGERSTLLRGSYSRFADQLATGVVSWANPIGLQSYVYFYGDTRGNGTIPSLSSMINLGGSSLYNPDTRGIVASSSVDSNLSAPITDELLLGIEHALRPELSVGLNLTMRKVSDLLEYERLVFDCAGTDQSCATSSENLGRLGRKHRRDDYVLVTNNSRIVRINGVDTVVPRQLPDGTPYTRSYYELRPGVSTRSGFAIENGDREQDFFGASVVLTKRLSNRWMLRGNFSWQDWTWNTSDAENEDPTRLLPGLIGATDDGEAVIQGSGTGSGSKGNIFLHANWSYSINGLYQVAPDRPWGFNVAAALTGRQGYPVIYHERVGRTTISDSPVGATVLVGNTDIVEFRNDDIRVLDLRLEKEFSFRDLGVTVGADLFNATNEATVLQRNGRLAAATANHVQEILSPRILRLGVKLSLR